MFLDTVLPKLTAFDLPFSLDLDPSMMISELQERESAIRDEGVEKLKRGDEDDL
jgi:hypothetical protein